MTDDALRKMLVAELALVEPTINELGYDTILDPDAEPVPALAVDLSDDGNGDHVALVVTIVQPDLFADHADVHFDVVLPFDVPAGRADDAEKAVEILNGETTTGTYELAGTTITLSHVLTVDGGSSVPDDDVRRIVTAVVAEHERYSDYLHGVVDGEISVLVLPDIIAADRP